MDGTDNQYERIPARIRKKLREDECGCLLWLGCTQPNGYGRVSVNYKAWLVHRYIYTLYHGEIPSGKVVRHACDVRNCCNPAHLLLGTAKDNIADMHKRGRANPPRGEQHFRSKLTERSVRKIREMWGSNLATLDQLAEQFAEQFGVSRAAVYQVVQRKAWSHVS